MELSVQAAHRTVRATSERQRHTAHIEGTYTQEDSFLGGVVKFLFEQNLCFITIFWQLEVKSLQEGHGSLITRICPKG